MNPDIEAYFEQCDIPSYNDYIRRWYSNNREVTLDSNRPGWINTQRYSVFGYHEQWIYEYRQPGPGFHCESGGIYNSKIYPVWIRIGDPHLHRMADYGAPLKENWKPKPIKHTSTYLDHIGRDVRNILFRYLILPETDSDVVAAKAAREHPVKIMKKYGGRNHKKGKKTINRYKGAHPTTIQHKWLRVMAQVCRSWNIHVKTYRSVVLDELLKKNWWSNRHDYNINFLLVEQNMTKQQSKHCRAVKKTRSRKSLVLLKSCLNAQQPSQDQPEIKSNIELKPQPKLMQKPQPNAMSFHVSIIQRNNQIAKWHRRITWYEKQLKDPKIPAPTARTFQATVDYLKKCDPPTQYSRYHWLSAIKRNHLADCNMKQSKSEPDSKSKSMLKFVTPLFSYAAVVKGIRQKHQNHMPRK